MKNFIEKYIIQTNIWVALCFTGLFGFFQLSLYEPIASTWFLVFFGTLAVYNFTRIANWHRFTNPQAKDNLSIMLTTLGLIGVLVSLVSRDFELEAFLYIGALGVLSFLYALPFPEKGLRYIPFLKLFLIAFVWAGSSVGLLMVVHEDVGRYFILFLAVMLFVIGIAIPFDIRDAHKDRPGLRTLPQALGNRRAKELALVSLVVSGFLFWLQFEELNSTVSIWFLGLVFSLLMVWNAKRERKDFYYTFWLESCSLIFLLLLMVYKFF